MFLFFPKFRHFLLLLLLPAAVACTKKEPDPQPTPGPTATGSVDGTISPVGSLSSISLSASGNSSVLQNIQPDVMGYFKFPFVADGTYNVSFQVNSYTNNVAPAPRTVTVTNGGRASLGTIVVNSTAPTSFALRGSVSWNVGGTIYTSTTIGGTATLTNGVVTSLQTLATAQSGTQANIVGLNMPYFDGPKLYRLENVMNSPWATYLRTSGGVPNGSFTTEYYNGLQGTVTVTAADANARTVNGTFGYTAYDRNGSVNQCTDRVTVSNGSFSLSY